MFDHGSRFCSIVNERGVVPPWFCERIKSEVTTEGFRDSNLQGGNSANTGEMLSYLSPVIDFVCSSRQLVLSSSCFGHANNCALDSPFVKSRKMRRLMFA